jgi:hypothetical protein
MEELELSRWGPATRVRIATARHSGDGEGAR